MLAKGEGACGGGVCKVTASQVTGRRCLLAGAQRGTVSEEGTCMFIASAPDDQSAGGTTREEPGRNWAFDQALIHAHLAGYTLIPLRGNKAPAGLRMWTAILAYGSRPTLAEQQELGAWHIPDAGKGFSGVGVVMRDGLLTLDMDTDDPGVWRVVREIVGEDVDTAPTCIGQRGAKVFFRTEDGQNPDRLYLHVKDTVDILMRGRQAVAPPTRHPKTGEPYRWRSAPLWDTPINELPVLTYAKIEALHERLGGKPSKRERARRATMAGKPAPGAVLDDLVPPKLRTFASRWSGHPDEIARMREALQLIPSDHYYDWLQFIPALNLHFGEPHAHILWRDWSAKSSKYRDGLVDPDKFYRDAVANMDAGKALRIGTIIERAKKHGFDATLARWPGLLAALKGQKPEATSNIDEIARHMPLGRRYQHGLLLYAAHDPTLTAADRTVIAALLMYDHNRDDRDNRLRWMLQETLARNSGTSVRGTRNSLKKLAERGYVVHDPEWRAQDYEHKGAFAVTPPDGLTWADIAYYEAINLGHDHETAAEGLDVDEGRLGAAVAARDGCGVPGEQEQPTAAKPANSSPSVSALVETAPEDLRALLVAAFNGELLPRLDETLPIPAHISRRYAAAEHLLSKFHRALVKLTAFLRDALIPSMNKIGAAKSFKASSWFPALPAVIQEQALVSIMGTGKTVQATKLAATMDAICSGRAALPFVAVQTAITWALARAQHDYRIGKAVDLTELSPAQAVRRFRLALCAVLHHWRVDAPGVEEVINLQKHAQAKRRREQAAAPPIKTGGVADRARGP